MPFNSHCKSSVLELYIARKIATQYYISRTFIADLYLYTALSDLTCHISQRFSSVHRGAMLSPVPLRQEVLLQSEVCAAFSAGSLLPRAWYDSMEVLYRVSRPGDALALMARAHVAGVVLREHMFWPALLPCCRRQDVTGAWCQSGITDHYKWYRFF